MLDEDPATPKGAQSPILGPCLLWPYDWMDQDITWYGGRPWPRPYCIRWGPSSPTKGAQQPPLFGPCHLWLSGRPSQQLLGSCLTVLYRARRVRRGVAAAQRGQVRVLSGAVRRHHVHDPPATIDALLRLQHHHPVRAHLRPRTRHLPSAARRRRKDRPRSDLVPCLLFLT